MAKRPKKTKRSIRSPTAVDKEGPMGWGDPDVDQFVRLDAERAQLYEAQCEHPIAYQARPAKSISPAMQKKLKAVHEKHHISDALTESIDLRLIFEAMFGSLWMWAPQIIGSCVASGGMRAWGIRSGWEIFALGSPEELLGRSREGFQSLMPYAPYNYGIGRRLGKMRSGDGSYCSVHIKGFQRFGVVPCSTKKLQTIVGPTATDYPETQDPGLYRDFGKWKHLDALTAYADYGLLESEQIRSAERGVEALLEAKPLMICSGQGWKSQSRHKDGFWIYKRGGSWSHNMTVVGVRKASDNNYFIGVLNSWGSRAHKDGEIFWIPIEAFDKWLKSASCQSVGDIDLPDSAPVMW